MPITEADEERILAAIARGEMKVRFTDGREVTYRSVSELREALSILRAQSIPMNRTTLPAYRRA
jgi:hypothetical protein